jgi:hypothetical protein
MQSRSALPTGSTTSPLRARAPAGSGTGGLDTLTTTPEPERTRSGLTRTSPASPPPRYFNLKALIRSAYFSVSRAYTP